MVYWEGTGQNTSEAQQDPFWKLLVCGQTSSLLGDPGPECISSVSWLLDPWFCLRRGSPIFSVLSCHRELFKVLNSYCSVSRRSTLSGSKPLALQAKTLSIFYRLPSTQAATMPKVMPHPFPSPLPSPQALVGKLFPSKRFRGHYALILHVPWSALRHSMLQQRVVCPHSS